MSSVGWVFLGLILTLLAILVLPVQLIPFIPIACLIILAGIGWQSVKEDQELW